MLEHENIKNMSDSTDPTRQDLYRKYLKHLHDPYIINLDRGREGVYKNLDYKYTCYKFLYAYCYLGRSVTESLTNASISTYHYSYMECEDLETHKELMFRMIDELGFSEDYKKIYDEVVLLPVKAHVIELYLKKDQSLINGLYDLVRRN